MFYIAICEDDAVQCRYEEQLVRRWAEKGKYKVSVDTYSNAEQLLFESEDKPVYDLFILDIQMGEMNGMRLAEKLRQRGLDSAIIFLTGIADYALEGYEVGAVRYLLKPLREKEFLTLLDTLFEKHKDRSRNYFVWEQGCNVCKVEFRDIIYVEARGHYLYLSTVNGEQEWKASFSSIADEFQEKSFFLLKRGLFVNLEHVEKITRTECVLEYGKILPVARNRYKELNEAFISYYRGKGK